MACVSDARLDVAITSVVRQDEDLDLNKVKKLIRGKVVASERK